MEECPHAQNIDGYIDLSEIHYEKMTRLLSVTTKGKIAYYYYPSAEVMERIMGGSGTGTAKDNAVHSIYPYHPHEITHLIAYCLGKPPALLSEGLAVLYGWDTGWKMKPVDEWAEAFIRDGTLIPLSSLLKTSSFRGYSDEITYPEAGSFVKFLINIYGMNKFKKLYSSASNENIEDLFIEIYKIPVEKIEGLWKNCTLGETIPQQEAARNQAYSYFENAFTLFTQANFTAAKVNFLLARDQYDKLQNMCKNDEARKRITEIDQNISRCDKGIQANAPFEEGIKLFVAKEFSNAKPKFEKAKKLYEEIGSNKAEEAGAMILKCEEENKKTETTTPAPVTQAPQKVTGISIYVFLFAFLLLSRKTYP